jgi:hypothetical protein
MSCNHRELPCALCGVFTRVEFLVDVTHLEPITRGPACLDCEHDLVAEHHDDETCGCASCDRARSKADRVRREAEAATCGGLIAESTTLLGWMEDEL